MSGNPLIVGIGGTLSENSSSERVLRECLSRFEVLGFETEIFAGPDLDIPHYRPNAPLPEVAAKLVESSRRADAVIIASPGYHGTISGLVKNALDYTEEMREDEHAYFQGRAVGCIAVAQGWQAAVITMTALRDIAHALRGWTAPLGITVNSSKPVFDSDGKCSDQSLNSNLDLLVLQLSEFVKRAPKWRSWNPG